MEKTLNKIDNLIIKIENVTFENYTYEEVIEMLENLKEEIKEL